MLCDWYFSIIRSYLYSIPTERPPLVDEVSVNCCVVNRTDPYGRMLGFLDRSRYYFFQVAPPLYSRAWVDPVSDPLLLRESGNRTRAYGSVARNSDHQTTEADCLFYCQYCTLFENMIKLGRFIADTLYTSFPWHAPWLCHSSYSGYRVSLHLIKTAPAL
jgi:hypothetical protein